MKKDSHPIKPIQPLYGKLHLFVFKKILAQFNAEELQATQESKLSQILWFFEVTNTVIHTLRRLLQVREKLLEETSTSSDSAVEPHWSQHPRSQPGEQ